jgi:hypothetical protein
MNDTKDLNQKSDAANQQLSEGEIIMNVMFNPSGRKDVNRIKLVAANLYDWLIKECTKVNEEGDMDRHNRKQRCKAVALTHLETFQINAVKAITFTKEFIDAERMIKPVPSEGYMVMTLDFNVTQRPDIAHIKKNCADIYDDMEDEMYYRQKYFAAEEKVYYDGLKTKRQEEFENLSAEGKIAKLEEDRKHQAFTMPQLSDELIMLHRKINHGAGAMSDALYSLRQFQHYAVKAVTR